MAFTPKNDGFGYATTRPGASSMSAAMQGGNMSSEEEDEDEDAEAADQHDPNSITQSFRRSTKMDEIQAKITAINASTKPLSIQVMTGSIHGECSGNLKVVQNGLGQFIRAL